MFREANWQRIALAVGVLTLALLAPRALATPDSQQPRPPLTPRWAYEPWVWEDEGNTSTAVRELLAGYRQRDIPVGVVIIDSPWMTNYNTFRFAENYSDASSLMQELDSSGMRVILWLTSFINVQSNDGPDLGKASNYDEALAAGYFVDQGRTVEWDKGWGSAIDFFNPSAVQWWYSQLDQAFQLGVDGWKVDSAEGNLPKSFQTAAGPKTEREYGEAYYRAHYEYLTDRNPDGIIMARAMDAGTLYAPVDVNTAGWVGDENPSWAGLREAFGDIVESSQRGFSMIGLDIGGYRRGERSRKLFIRWSQLGALVPLMENGGRGEHRPWVLGEDVLENYRYYAKLHRELVPYLYSAGVDAHIGGPPIIRNANPRLAQYELGQDLLVAPILSEDDSRTVQLPDGSRWHDYWRDDVVHNGGQTLDITAHLMRAPLFIRAGAIIPLEVEDALTRHGGRGSAGSLTLLIYPDGDSTRVYRPGPDQALTFSSRRTSAETTIELDRQTEEYVLRIKESRSPANVQLSREGALTSMPMASSFAEFDGATESAYFDAEHSYLWVRFATRMTGARVTYSTTVQ
jgi:alpha-glucosidase (family GH31 glycosyl hydrolase)